MFNSEGEHVRTMRYFPYYMGTIGLLISHGMGVLPQNISLQEYAASGELLRALIISGGAYSAGVFICYLTNALSSRS